MSRAEWGWLLAAGALMGCGLALLIALLKQV